MTRRILLVQLADIGDLVTTTPAIQALREAFPEAHLTLLTTTHSAPILENTGLVNDVITFDRQSFNSSIAFFKPANLKRIFALRGGNYDTVIYCHHFTLKLGTLKFALIALASGAKQRYGIDNGNGWFLTDRISDEGYGAKHQADYWLTLVALLGANASPRPQKTARTDFSLPPHDGIRVAIHAGSGGYSLARRWEPAKFAQVADTLAEKHDAQIILVGGTGDDTQVVKSAMRVEPIDLTGTTTLAELADVISQCDLYIGTDSGVMHIAASTGTSVLAIFGPSNHEAWSPYAPDSKTVVVRSAPECSPCSYVGHGVGLREGCAARTCMRMITAQNVIEATEKLLGGQTIEPMTSSTRTIHANIPRIQILGLPVDAITYEQWLDLIHQWITSADRVHHVCTTNPEFMMVAQNDVNFRNILHRADLCVPDGVGLLWAAKRQGTPLPERVTGSDGVPIIAERAAQMGWKLFFLGAGEGIAEQAANILREKYPDLQIVGTYSGSPAPEDEDAIVDIVNASDADILFVAYGAPEQDKWIARNSPRLKVSMAMGVGGAFDFIAGVVPRAPLWMRNLGIEWLYRLYLQPWRIKRMMRLPRFVLKVLMSKNTS